MIAKLGQDGHDRGAKVVATALADLGFDVDIGPAVPDAGGGRPRRPSRTTATRSACPRWPAHKHASCRRSIQELRRQGADDIAVFAGGVIPPQEVAGLRAAGVVAVLGPGTPIVDCARTLLAGIRASHT